jgi:predicted nucleotidyltransferase
MNTQDNYIQYWKNKISQQKQNHIEEKRKAREILKTIKQVLIEEFKVNKIILFGSLLTDKFDKESDIDLAVEGIKKDEYFRAFSMVNDLGKKYLIDLKPLEDLEPYFLEKVLKKGECIYEKNK